MIIRKSKRAVYYHGVGRDTPFPDYGRDWPRFWSKVSKEGPIQSHMKTSCWVWLAAKTSKGYGAFGTWGDGGSGAKRSRSAHVCAYMLFHGLSKAPTLYVLHKCDNRQCVRPSHLFLGTHKDNMADMARKGRAPGFRGYKDARSSSLLNEEQIVAMRNKRQTGLSYQKLGALFGVRKDYARKICVGLLGSYAPGPLDTSKKRFR